MERSFNIKANNVRFQHGMASKARPGENRATFYHQTQLSLSRRQFIKTALYGISYTATYLLLHKQIVIITRVTPKLQLNLVILCFHSVSGDHFCVYTIYVYLNVTLCVHCIAFLATIHILIDHLIINIKKNLIKRN